MNMDFDEVWNHLEKEGWKLHYDEKNIEYFISPDPIDVNYGCITITAKNFKKFHNFTDELTMKEYVKEKYKNSIRTNNNSVANDIYSSNNQILKHELPKYDSELLNLKESTTNNINKQINHKPILIYPMEIERKDFISITTQDINRLEKGEWLNDNLIDFYNQYYMDNFDFSCHVDNNNTSNNIPIHYYNCLFYNQFISKSNNDKNISNWTKHIDIFTKEFLFIHINRNNHWSLFVIVRPGLLLPSISNNNNTNQSCILHFDSLSFHNTDVITENIKLYLIEEYINKKNSNNNTLIEKFKQNIYEMKIIFLEQIPKQSNNYDCGIYLIKYFQYFLQQWPTSTLHDINTKFSDYFNITMFGQDDITNIRTEIKTTIMKLEPEYKIWNENQQYEYKINIEKQIKLLQSQIYELQNELDDNIDSVEILSSNNNSIVNSDLSSIEDNNIKIVENNFSSPDLSASNSSIITNSRKRSISIVNNENNNNEDSSIDNIESELDSNSTIDNNISNLSSSTNTNKYNQSNIKDISTNTIVYKYKNKSSNTTNRQIKGKSQSSAITNITITTDNGAINNRINKLTQQALKKVSPIELIKLFENLMVDLIESNNTTTPIKKKTLMSSKCDTSNVYDAPIGSIINNNNILNKKQKVSKIMHDSSLQSIPAVTLDQCFPPNAGNFCVYQNIFKTKLSFNYSEMSSEFIDYLIKHPKREIINNKTDKINDGIRYQISTNDVDYTNFKDFEIIINEIKHNIQSIVQNLNQCDSFNFTMQPMKFIFNNDELLDEQALHYDYKSGKVPNDLRNIPYSVIISLTSNNHVYIYDKYYSELLNVRLNLGDIVLFPATTLHGGGEYHQKRLSLFAYITCQSHASVGQEKTPITKNFREAYESTIFRFVTTTKSNNNFSLAKSGVNMSEPFFNFNLLKCKLNKTNDSDDKSLHSYIEKYELDDNHLKSFYYGDDQLQGIPYIILIIYVK